MSVSLKLVGYDELVHFVRLNESMSLHLNPNGMRYVGGQRERECRWTPVMTMGCKASKEEGDPNPL